MALGVWRVSNASLSSLSDSPTLLLFAGVWLDGRLTPPFHLFYALFCVLMAILQTEEDVLLDYEDEAAEAETSEPAAAAALTSAGKCVP